MFKLQKSKLTFYLCLACIILILASFIPFLRPLALDIFRLPLNVATLAGREVRAIVFYHHNYIASDRLSKENDFLKNKLNQELELYLENKRLKALLLFKQKTSFKVLAAAVIGRSPDNWSSAVIIDKGSRAGVKRGAVVINYLGLVGRVSETGLETAKVILINDPNLSVSCIDQRSRQEGLVSGTLGSYLVMKYLPKDADLKISDTVLTSGLTAIYPKGLIIGNIVDTGEEFSGLSRYCLIKPAVNLSSVEEVLIIIQ